MIFLGVVLPAGTGAICLGIIMGAVTPLLDKKAAALMSGIVVASSGIGVSLIAPALQALLSSFGLEGALRTLLLPVLVLIPAAVLLTRGGTAAVDESGEERPALRISLLLNRAWILVTAAFFTCGFHMSIIETHLFSQIVTSGIAEQTAALAFSLYGVTKIIGSFASG